MTPPISELDSEFILDNFKDITDGPFADLAASLRELNSLPSTLAPIEPPLYPSQVLKNVRPLQRGTGRTIATAFVATSLVASSMLGAVALTGYGPKPIVNFAKSTFKTIESIGTSAYLAVISPILHIATGTTSPNSVQSPPEQATPSPATSDGGNLTSNVPESSAPASAPTEAVTQANTKESNHPEALGQSIHEPAEQHPVLSNTSPEHDVASTPSAAPEPSKKVEKPEKIEVKPTENATGETSQSSEVQQEVKTTPLPIPAPKVSEKSSEKPEPKPTQVLIPAPKPTESEKPEQTIEGQ